MPVEVNGNRLVFLGAMPNSVYTVREQDFEPKKITIEFESSVHKTKLTAELEDSGVEWKAEEEDESPD